MHRALQRILAVAGFMGSTVGASAYAQTHAEDETTWRGLVASALTARTAGDHVRALELSRRALETHATPSLEWFVAGEESALGQVVPALALAQRCVDGATADPNLPERAATLAGCATLEHELEGRVGRVVFQPPDPVPTGLQVSVAGTPLPTALVGVPYVLAPGTVTVVAQAPDRQGFRRDVTVTAGESITLPLIMPALPPQMHPPAPALHPITPPDNDLPVVVAPSSTVRNVAIGTAIGAGAAAVLGIVAVAVGTQAAGTFNGNAQCIQHLGVTYGPADCQSSASTASTMASLAAGSFIGTAALGVTSAVLWLTIALRHGAPPHTAAFACGEGPGRLGIACGVAF